MTCLESAPPPIHAVAVSGLVLSFSFYHFPALESIDEVATVETFTERIYPSIISVELLGWIRMAFSFFILGVTIYKIRYERLLHVPSYLPNSKLISAQMTFTGFQTQAYFTSCTWNLLGCSFFVSGLIPLIVSHNKEKEINQWILRFALILFETVAPCTMLTSFVVKYAIWPKLLKSGGSARTHQLKKIPTLIQHNINSILLLIEISLLGGLPLELSHMSFAPLYGFCYVFFSWAMANHWISGKGPQFLYFFLDTTLGIKTSVALLILLSVLLLFFVLFWALDEIFHHLGGSVCVRVVGVWLGSLLVCRFRD